MCGVVGSARVLVLGFFALGVAMAAGAAAQELDKPVSGVGIIDRVIATGAEPVFRADGYTFRVNAATEVKFGVGLTTLADVGANTLATFQGKGNGSGEIVAAKVEFDRVKLPKRKPQSADVQVTDFSADSRVDGSKGLVDPHNDPSYGTTNFAPQDEGGWCAWYTVPKDSAVQEHIRQIGNRVVPQYQRELAADDPDKIPFRFYVVAGTPIRKAIFCERGLVLVPAVAMERLKSDDLLAAVLAEGIAGELQEQAEQSRTFRARYGTKLAVGAAGAVASGFGAGVLGGLAMAGEDVRESRGMQHARARMSLALMADAGYDPHQAPEAWRLLGPEYLPKNMTKLKYPERSQYLSQVLEAQYGPADATRP